MDKLLMEHRDSTYAYKAFKGIGGFTKKNTVKETRTNKLLNDLMTYMRGFQRSLQGIDAAIIIVLDNDDRDPEQFKKELTDIALINKISIDHVFCLAIEEVEAWLLGDTNAVINAYPNAKVNIMREYEQDSICGTWELLADVVYKGGMRQIIKKKMSYMEIGKLKCEWAANIGKYMILENNVSPSFKFFVNTINERLAS